MNTAVVILAAGQGTRMRSKIPKVLHPLGGQPMVKYVVNLALQFSTQAPVLVIGRGAALVRDRVGDCVRYVLQETRLGTGHAVLQARDELRGRSDAVLVLYGDMPLLTPPTVSRLADCFASTTPAIAMLTLEIPPGGDTMGFGRVVRDAKGRVIRVVEEAFATPEELDIRELNCGVYFFHGPWLWDHLTRLQISPKGEYMLTDLVGIAVSEGERVEAVRVDDPEDVIGINDRLQLARAEEVLRRRVNQELMRSGVTLIDPATTYVEVGVRVAPDTVIYPNTYLLGNTEVGDDCILGPNTLLRNATLGPRCRVVASIVEDSALGAGVIVEPYGCLRGGARLDDGVRLGSFAEVKNSYLGPGTEVEHSSYVGDATVEANVRIGAGAVTCNRDGEERRATQIGEGALIGGGAMLVAPLVVGPGARVGAGSVVTHDVPPNTVVYGVPARVHRMAEDARIQTGPAEAERQAQGVSGRGRR
ncbi:MAG: bifunctional UDP-N-acetylglucosamine diphosphorylase/glucosamine-1-phosphate N-acetyltransferase GlmU [Anaerolineae bacterium]|nr:bifunctional UDP-N-acetylglucosamine diphosphorylase/glucosamine-1-phosphate N-acetyltransferase GlmU [Anaerolineae bacterium]